MFFMAMPALAWTSFPPDVLRPDGVWAASIAACATAVGFTIPRSRGAKASGFLWVCGCARQESFFLFGRPYSRT